MEKREYAGFKAYSQSKRAIRMMTWKLVQRLAGSDVVANAVSPGFVKTDFMQHISGFVAGLIRMLWFMADTPEKGADTTLWLASAPEMANVTGKYVEARKEKDGKFREQPALDRLEKLLDKKTGASSSLVNFLPSLRSDELYQ